MADEATVNQSIVEIQPILSAYSPTYAGAAGTSLDDTGQLPAGLYEGIGAFVRRLAGIDTVARALNAQGVRLDDANDPAVMSALVPYLRGPELEAQRTALEAGDAAQVRSYLREQGFPDVFVQDPEKLFIFIDQDLDTFSAALGVFEEGGYLNAPPVSAELRAAQPQAVTDLNALLGEAHSAFYAMTLETRERLIAEKAADSDQSEERQALYDGMIATTGRSIERLDEMQAQLGAAQFTEFGFDENARAALETYMQFLQENIGLSSYGVQDGSYSTGFQAHLDQVIAGKDAVLAGQPEVIQEEAQEVFGYLERTQAVMGALVRTGLYAQPQVAGDPSADAAVVAARPVIDQAIRSISQKDRVEIGISRASAESADFNLDERMLLQAFVIDLKEFLDIEAEPGSGRITDALQTQLNTALANPDTLRRVADEYFQGNLQSAQGLASALATYASPERVPLVAGVSSDIRTADLITKPVPRDAEVEVIEMAVRRIPESELAGINELVATLSGYGLEDFMPEGSLSAEDAQSLHASVRSEALSDLFVLVHAESVQALEREGRPISELQQEMTARMIERVAPFTDGTALFAGSHVAGLEQEISRAIETGLRLEQRFGVETSASAFVSAMPGAGAFLERHGANVRAYKVFDTARLEAVMPVSIEGFGGARAQVPATVDVAVAGQTIEAMIADMADDYEYLEASPIAQETLRGVAQSLAANRAILENIYESGEKLDGRMIVTDRHGESLLLSMGEEGMEIRYLDALGISDVAGVPQVEYQDALGYEEQMLQAALAGYQSLNQFAPHISNFNPEFFEVGGRHYVVGVDKESSILQIHEIKPEFITVEHAAQISYATGAEAYEDARRTMMQDEAYRFIRDNYGSQFGPAGSPDRVFQVMARQLADGGNETARDALAIFGQRDGYASDIAIDIRTLPRESDPAVLAGAQTIIGARPQDVQDTSFIYLRKAEDGSGRIYVATPAMREVQTNDGGTLRTSLVIDPAAAPVVYDITDPEVFKRLRDDLVRWDESGLSLRWQVIPQELLNDEAFSGFYNWVLEGAPPMLRTAIPVPAVPAPTEEGMRSLGESASGFSIAGVDVTPGQAITDIGALHAVLGYDPNAMFAAQRLENPSATFIVHGLEADRWNGAEGTHEFLEDNLLVTYQKDGEIQTFAISKDVFDSNPARLPALLGLVHDGDTAPDVLMADASRPIAEESGIFIPTVDLAYTLYRRDQTYQQREAGPGERSVLPREWTLDAQNYQRALDELQAIQDRLEGLQRGRLRAPEEAEAGVAEPEAEISREEVFRLNCAEITEPVPEECAAISGDRAPVRTPALAVPRN